LRNGQTAITVTFWIIIFLVVLGLFFASFTTTWTNQAITKNNLTGIEAFVLSNLNIIIYVAALIFALAALTWGER